MATIKSFSDIPQSKVLSKILPRDSADMGYLWNGTSFCEYPVSNQTIFKRIENIPCWSLAALFVTLPFPVLYMEMIGGMILWCCECHFIETDEVIKIENYDSPVDACYELILKLNELHLL